MQRGRLEDLETLRGKEKTYKEIQKIFYRLDKNEPRRRIEPFDEGFPVSAGADKTHQSAAKRIGRRQVLSEDILPSQE